MVVPAVPSLTTIETWLRTQVPLTTPAPPSARGRPPILPGAMLWAGLLLCVLRGWTSQRELWRLLSVHGVWDFPAQPISDDAVYRRLERDGDAPMRALLETVTTTLLDAAVPDTTLAPFATEVVAIDETTLDPVARRWPPSSMCAASSTGRCSTPPIRDRTSGCWPARWWSCCRRAA